MARWRGRCVFVFVSIVLPRVYSKGTDYWGLIIVPSGLFLLLYLLYAVCYQGVLCFVSGVVELILILEQKLDSLTFAAYAS